MRFDLRYGKSSLRVELPDERVAAVLEHRPAAPIADLDSAITEMLARPIGSGPLVEIARGQKSACILICDVTRPVPNERILPPVLKTLHEASVRKEDILILVATGLHRPNEGAELVELVGAEVAAQYRIENHLGKDRDSHSYLGTTPNGVPVYIDRRYVDADLKITTGLIEPHLMAGYSGGRKVICPGIAGLDTVRAWHSPKFLEHPRAIAGIIEGNPVHEENTRIAQMAGCDFIVNVCLDGLRRITKVVAGDMIQAWHEGVAFCRRHATATLPEPVDVVVTSCAGYPLDTTFYQSVKGLTGALPIVKPGGTIVLAASLSEGIGSPEFISLLDQTDSLDRFVEQIKQPDFFVMDQWQLEELAKVVRHCTVKMVSSGIPANRLRQFFVEPAETVESAVADALLRHGPSARIAVIPEGPYVLAELG